MVACHCAHAVAGRRRTIRSFSTDRLRRFAGLAAIFWIASLEPRAATAQRLPFTTYSTDDGLAASQVWHVLQDSRGYLWVSTTWGLCRWDGVSFGTLSIPDGLPSATARVAVEAADGTLWLGTNGGIAAYDGKRIVSYADRGGALGATIWSAAVDRHGAVWFGSDHGLVSYDGKEFRTFLRADGLADDYVYSLLPASDGALWLGSRGRGVTRCTLQPGGLLGSCRVFTTADGLANDAVRAIAEDRSGALFFATRGGGLSRFDGRAFTRLTVADGLPADDLYALLVTRDGRELLVGSTAGVGVCPLPEAHPCRLLREGNGLADNEVHSLLEDREGSFWIGSEGGVSRLVRKEMWSYGEAEGLPDSQVFALASDGDGGIWAGTVDGLGHLTFGADGEPGSRIWRKAEGLPADWVWALLRSRRGDLWVGSEEGLSRLLPAGGFETLKVADGLAANYVVSLFEDSSGALWAGSIDGLTRLRFDAAGRRSEIRTFGKADGLATERTYVVAEDAGGRIFVAHGESLSYLDGDRFQQVGRDSGLDTGSVRALGRTDDGTLWVGGYARLARLVADPGKGPPRFVPFGAASGLADSLVLTIADDHQGRLLLGTNHGVLSFDPTARDGLGAVLARFDRAAGTIASEVSHSSAFARDAAGRFWFGFKGGVTAFPADLGQPRVPDPPPVVIERLATRSGSEWLAPFSGRSLTGELQLGAQPIVLSHEDSNLRVEVRALTLRGEAQVRFQFQLVGFESTWSEPQTEAFRDYTNLDPGPYRLQARAALATGAWSAPVELALEVSPAWYQRRLVRLLLALGGLAAFFAAATFRTRRIRAQNRALEKDVGERTDDLARYTRALEEHAHALDRANERIRLADRHRSEFLAKMSHELRTPLTSVLGFAALLADGLGNAPEPRHARYLENIRESGNQLLRLINNLLDQAKIEAGRMDLQLEPASLEAIVESALALMEGYGSTRGVHLKATFGGQAPAIVVDVAKLRQVILNLLSNAIKFSGKGSEVEVRTRFLPASAGGLGVDGYEIVVADQGPGIEPADQERIFEPFLQLATRGEAVPAPGSVSRSRASSRLSWAAFSRWSRRSAKGPPSAFCCQWMRRCVPRASVSRQHSARPPRGTGRGWWCSSRTADGSPWWPATSNARAFSPCAHPTAKKAAGWCVSCARRWSRSTSSRLASRPGRTCSPSSPISRERELRWCCSPSPQAANAAWRRASSASCSRRPPVASSSRRCVWRYRRVDGFRAPAGSLPPDSARSGSPRPIATLRPSSMWSSWRPVSRRIARRRRTVRRRRPLAADLARLPSIWRTAMPAGSSWRSSFRPVAVRRWPGSPWCRAS